MVMSMSLSTVPVAALHSGRRYLHQLLVTGAAGGCSANVKEFHTFLILIGNITATTTGIF